MKVKFRVRNIKGGRVLRCFDECESESALMDAAIARRDRAMAERRARLMQAITGVLNTQGGKHEVIDKV